MRKLLLYTLLFFIMILTPLSIPKVSHEQALDQGYIDYYNPLLNGVTCTSATLQAAITAIGSAQRTLYLTATDRNKIACVWAITQSITIPINIRLKIPYGVTATLTAPAVLTVQNCLDDDDHETWYSGTGSLVATRCETTAAEWLGPPFMNYIQVGGLHSISGTTTITLPSTIAWIQQANQGTKPLLQRAEETVPQQVTFTAGDGTYYTSMRLDLAVIPSGWTCVGGTHYCWIQNTAVPTLPDGLVLLSQSTVSGGAVTIVQDRRQGNPSSPTINALDPMFGVVADGVTDDTAALNAVCARLTPQLPVPDADQRSLVFPGNRVYRIPNGGWKCELPNNTIVTAYGATFESTIDHTTPLVTLNDDGDCSQSGGCLNPIRNVWWFGGTFFNTLTEGTATQAVAMDVQAIRGFTIRDSNFQGFWRAMQVTVQDNFYVQNTNFTCHGIDGACIIQPDNANQSASDGWNIENCLFQGQNSPSDYAIYKGQGGLTRQAYIRGNTFAGDWDSGHIVWEAGNSASVTPTVEIRIENNHFEQMPSGGHYLWLKSTTSTFGYHDIRIVGNHLPMSPCTVNCTDIEVNGTLAHSTIKNNRVNVGAGGSNKRHIVLTGTINRIEIGPEEVDADLTSFLDTSGVTTGSRKEVEIFPTLRLAEPPPGYIPSFQGTGQSDLTATIDMSTELAGFGGDPFLYGPPRAYWAFMTIRDSGSAAAGADTCFTRLAQSGTVTNPRSIYCSCAGVPNDNYISCQGYVQADVNGDIYLEVNATGAATLDLFIGVHAVIQ